MIRYALSVNLSTSSVPHGPTSTDTVFLTTSYGLVLIRCFALLHMAHIQIQCTTCVSTCTLLVRRYSSTGMWRYGQRDIECHDPPGDGRARPRRLGATAFWCRGLWGRIVALACTLVAPPFWSWARLYDIALCIFIVFLRVIMHAGVKKASGDAATPELASVALNISTYYTF